MCGGEAYARGDIGQEWARAYRLPIPKHAPFAIGYTFEGNPHDYLPDVVGTLQSGKLFISMTAIQEHTEMQQVATRLSAQTGTTVKLPSYKQVRTEVNRLKMEPALVAVREQAKSVPRARESAQSFALSIPAPALFTQVDEHSLELYVVTPDGIPVASRVHAAVLVCVKTAAIPFHLTGRLLMSRGGF